MSTLTAFTVTRSAMQAPGYDRGADWRERAECRDVDPVVFEPDDTHTPREDEWDEPRSICRGCPVIDACLADAMSTEGQDDPVRDAGWLDPHGAGVPRAPQEPVVRRAPSVQDYARMTQRARTAAAEIAAHQAAVLEAARDRITGADWVRHLHTGADVERLAALARHPEDTPDVQRGRVLTAQAATKTRRTP